MTGPGSRSAVAAPTFASARDGVRQVLGEDFAATWLAVCAAADVPETATGLDDADFTRFLAIVSEESPLLRVLAMSWQIRRTASRKLAEIGR